MTTTPVRASDVASFLSEIQEEFSPDRLHGYTQDVKEHLPASACADLDDAYQQLALAHACIQKAVSRLSLGTLL